MIRPGYIARHAGVPYWATGYVTRDREQRLHRWGWSSDTIEACRLAEIQQVCRAVASRRKVHLGDSDAWD